MPFAVVPTVIERSPRGERGMDIFSRLLRERVVLLGTPIDEDVGTSIVAQLLFLQHSDPDRDVWLYINSPGGSVHNGLAILDTMNLITPDVNTVCIGRAGSMATMLLAAGAKGKRFALPHSTIHFHPAGGGVEGYAPDLERAVNELLRLQRLGNEIIAKATGHTAEEIEQDFSRDKFLTPTEALAYGLIDQILDQTGATPK